jgi:hypothetical protein
MEVPQAITAPANTAAHSDIHLSSAYERAATTYTYDGQGHRMTRTDPLDKTTYPYSTAGLLTKVINSEHRDMSALAPG